MQKRHFARLLTLLTALTLLLGVLSPRAIAAQAVRATAFTVLPETTGAERAAPALSAASAVLFDPVEQLFLLEKDADTRRPMASTTKIMTALLVLELLPLDGVVTVPVGAVGVEGSSIYLYAGEQITVRTLLYALLLSSANDAAVALALHTAGSIEAFAEQMNRKAAELGLENTHFTNPHGLHDEGHYTTARDLARLCAAALANDGFAEIVATGRYSAPQSGTDQTRLFLNHNRLLRSYEGAIGVKTGFTKKSGRCLVSAAERDGLTLIAVTLNAPDDWRDHTALLDWGFTERVAMSAAPPTLSLSVVGGTVEAVLLEPEGRLCRTLPASHGAVTCTVEVPHFLFAPVEAGTAVGRAVYEMDGQYLGEVALRTAASVAQPAARSPWARLKRFLAALLA